MAAEEDVVIFLYFRNTLMLFLSLKTRSCQELIQALLQVSLCSRLTLEKIGTCTKMTFEF